MRWCDVTKPKFIHRPITRNKLVRLEFVQREQTAICRRFLFVPSLYTKKAVIRFGNLPKIVNKGRFWIDISRRGIGVKNKPRIDHYSIMNYSGIMFLNKKEFHIKQPPSQKVLFDVSYLKDKHEHKSLKIHPHVVLIIIKIGL